MGDTVNAVRALKSLRSELLGDDWINDVWNQEFADYEEVPQEYTNILNETDYLLRDLKHISASLKKCLEKSQNSSIEEFWTLHVDQGLSRKSIIAVLFYVFEVGQKKTATALQKESSSHAADVYFCLIRIPGSGAFKIYHPVLFEKMVNLFKTWDTLEAANTSQTSRRPSSPVRSSQGSQRGKGKKNTRRSEDEPEVSESQMETEDAEDGCQLTEHEAIKLQKSMIAALRSFVLMLGAYSLKGSDHVLVQVSQVLADLSRYEIDHADVNFADEIPIARLSTISQLAFRGMNHLWSGLHGEPNARVNTVFKYLLPSILMLVGKNRKSSLQTIPRRISNIKDVTVKYVCYVLRREIVDVARTAYYLVQQMCMQVPDKAEYRTRVAQSIVEIMKSFPIIEYAKSVEWIYKFSRSNKIPRRVFALDLAVLLLAEPERTIIDQVDFPAELRDYLSHRFLMQLMLSRCSDVASTVRTRAIAVFSQCTESPEAPITNAIKDLVTPIPSQRAPVSRLPPGLLAPDSIGHHGRESTESIPGPIPVLQMSEASDRTSLGEVDSGRASTGTIASASGSFATDNITPQTSALCGSTIRVPSSMKTIALSPGLGITMSDGKGMSSMLRARAGDKKVNVRKSALQALESIVTLVGDDYNPEDVEVIKDRCQDPALSVRKQGIVSLCNLLNLRSADPTIQKAFLDGVVPLVMDRETSVQEKCMETLEAVMFSNIVQSQKSTGERQKLAWALLNRMAGNDEVELRAYLMKTFQHWGREGKIKVSLITAVLSHIGTENNPGTWMFLAALAQFAPKFKTKPIVEYWNDTAKTATENEYHTVGRVLNVLGHVAKYIEADQLSLLATDLKEKLMQFNMPAELTSATITTLNKLCRAQAALDDGAGDNIAQWFGDILQSCDRYLSEIVLNEGADVELDEDRIVRHLFTLGELAQQCPQKTPKRVFLLVESLIAAPVITSSDWNFQDVSGSDLATQGTQGTQVLTQFKGSKMGPKIRAHAFITLGKLCLQHEKLAKKCVPAMAKELETVEDPCIRNNIAIILCDLCFRYTTLVDRHFSNISAGIKDDFMLIRKQTLILLTHLLQEDFLKWKGSLFFRFISGIVDDNKEIKEFAEFCLVHILFKRHPNMFFNNLIECVFHFNGYTEHAAYNKFAQTEKEIKTFTLAGPGNKDKRMYIYKFMIENMTDFHRFQTSSKLVQEVLAAVVDEVMPLNPNTIPILQDTLTILSSKGIKLTSMKAKPTDDVAENEQEMAAMVANAAKKKIISVVMRKNVIEITIPTVISLKHILERQRSPVLKDLMAYLRELMKDYKDEVQDILAADRQLAREIEYDLEQFEGSQRNAADSRVIQRPGSPRPGTPRRGQRTQGGTPGRPVGTPRGTPPRTPVRTPGGDGKRVAFSPHGLAGPRTGTPSRPISMATMAVLNSARQAMERARAAEGDADGTPPAAAESDEDSPSSSCASNKPKKVNWSDQKDAESGADQDSQEDQEKQFKTPKTNRVLRAISTPSTNLSMLNNITFQGDNLSMIIPPSPLSNPGERSPSFEAEEPELETREKAPVIHMFSPDRPAPRPRQWNISSPARTRDKTRPKRGNKEN